MLNLGGLDLQQQFALNYNIAKIYLFIKDWVDGQMCEKSKEKC